MLQPVLPATVCAWVYITARVSSECVISVPCIIYAAQILHTLSQWFWPTAMSSQALLASLSVIVRLI